MVSGVPTTTTSPPRDPPSGPRSITQSAVLMMSRLCSMTRIEPPASINRRKAAKSLLTSSKCRPVVHHVPNRLFQRVDGAGKRCRERRPTRGGGQVTGNRAHLADDDLCRPAAVARQLATDQIVG